MVLTTCSSCSGFLPASAASCPHCGAAAVRPGSRAGVDKGVVGGIVALAAGGATAVTLMACYGLPPCESTQTCGTGGTGTTSSTGSGTGTTTTSTTSTSTTSTSTTSTSTTTTSTSGGTGGGPPSCTHCAEQMLMPKMDTSKLCTGSVQIWDNYFACVCQQGGACFSACQFDPHCPTAAADAGADDTCTNCLLAPAPNGCKSVANTCLGDG